MTEAKKTPKKKAFDAKKLLKDIKEGTDVIPQTPLWRGARKALVMAHNQLNDAITENKKLK